jgi:hypothetical protein
LFTLAKKIQSVLYCIFVEIPLFEELEGAGEFVEADRPSLPFLVLVDPLLDENALKQVPAPGSADQNGISSKCFDEFGVFEEVSSFLVSDLVFVALAGGSINGEGPPIIVAVVEVTVSVLEIPFFEEAALFQALFFYHLPFCHP